MCPGNHLLGSNISKVSGSNKNDSFENSQIVGAEGADRIPKINGFKATIKASSN
jgi:hypothetical protein